MKMAVAFYLLPLPKFKYHIKEIVFRLFPALVPEAETGIIDTSYSFYISSDGGMELSPKLKALWIFLLCLMLIAFVIAVIQVMRYREAKKVCLKYSAMKPGAEGMRQLLRLKEELNVKKNVKLLYSSYCKSPMTMGIFVPSIIVPFDMDETPANFNYVLKHELTHIKYNDLAIRGLGLAVMILHWFNPLAYLLFYELGIVSEMACDNRVIHGLNAEECRCYGSLIIDYAEQDMEKGRFSIGLSARKWYLERRLKEMKQNRKKCRILSFIMAWIIFCMGGRAVFAYDSPKEFEEGFCLDSTYEYVAEKDFEVLPYDYFFIDEDGNVFDLSEYSASSYSDCSHAFSSKGTVKEHRKKADGSCEVIHREAWKCSNCGFVKFGDIFGRESYLKCPHK